ncbi:MAG: hypothetical protein QOH58_1506 [Thermoleophilaceae bacterium]|nr:hypothetical protein [Thermoleophilaceae bacterium]
MKVAVSALGMLAKVNPVGTSIARRGIALSSYAATDVGIPGVGYVAHQLYEAPADVCHAGVSRDSAANLSLPIPPYVKRDRLPGRTHVQRHVSVERAVPHSDRILESAGPDTGLVYAVREPEQPWRQASCQGGEAPADAIDREGSQVGTPDAPDRTF